MANIGQERSGLSQVLDKAQVGFLKPVNAHSSTKDEGALDHQKKMSLRKNIKVGKVKALGDKKHSLVGSIPNSNYNFSSNFGSNPSAFASKKSVQHDGLIKNKLSPRS